MYLIESCIALDCYSCYSKNGSDRTCDDPMIRMYKDVIDPVPCVLPTPMKNYQNDSSEVDVVGLNGTKEMGTKYEVITPEELNPERYCVKVIGTTSKSININSHQVTKRFPLGDRHFQKTNGRV